MCVTEKFKGCGMYIRSKPLVTIAENAQSPIKMEIKRVDRKKAPEPVADDFIDTNVDEEEEPVDLDTEEMFEEYELCNNSEERNLSESQTSNNNFGRILLEKQTAEDTLEENKNLITAKARTVKISANMMKANLYRVSWYEDACKCWYISVVSLNLPVSENSLAAKAGYQKGTFKNGGTLIGSKSLNPGESNLIATDASFGEDEEIMNMEDETSDEFGEDDGFLGPNTDFSNRVLTEDGTELKRGKIM